MASSWTLFFAVYTVKNCSWGWASLSPETCRADLKSSINEICCILLVCFHRCTKRPMTKNMCFQGAHIYQMAEDLYVPNFVLFLSLGFSIFVWSHFSTPPTLLLYFLTDYGIIASFCIPSLLPLLHDKCWESQHPPPTPLTSPFQGYHWDFICVRNFFSPFPVSLQTEHHGDIFATLFHECRSVCLSMKWPIRRCKRSYIQIHKLCSF